MLDPFCGSGTVLLEGVLAGALPDGADANPLARLISSVKIRHYSAERLSEQLSEIMGRIASEPGDYPDVVNIDYWFLPSIKAQLGKLRGAIISCQDLDIRDFFLVSFSSCVKRVSLADPRLSVPVRINPARAEHYGAKGDEVLRRLARLQDVDVSKVFWSIASQNIARTRRYGERVPNGRRPSSIFEDARAVDRDEGYYDLIITSPPYAGAQKYIRASSLCLGWLGYTPNSALRPLERASIGREHLGHHERRSLPNETSFDDDPLLQEIREKNPLRADIARQYLVDMRDALTEMARVLRPDGHLVLVTGANLVTGLEFKTPVYLEALAKAAGFAVELRLVDTIKSRGLMTKRNKTAGLISQEAVTVFKRLGGMN